jgi:serine/threonine-protein kinase
VDARLARPVAVKVVKDDGGLAPSEREQYLARFRQEAQAAGRLSHPDIVQVYDVGPTFLVMEFVEGRTLSDVIRAGPALTVGESCALLLRVGDALDYAHRQGVVHRDVKPANIMRLDDGGVKVMDFGVARLPSSTLTAFGTVVGSVRYMAPEQMLGRTVDGRADVFSLGAVAYELLTGRAPYPGKTATEVVTRVVHGEHVPAREVEPRLPPACDGVFARVFAPDPERRFARAAEFARALHEAAQDVAGLRLRDPRPDSSEGPLSVRTTAVYAPTDATRLLARAPEEAPGETRVLPAAGALVAIDSRPRGARVRVDGVEVGATPIEGLPLAPGRTGLEFELDGHAPARLEVDLAAGDWRALSVSLEPRLADEVAAFTPGVVPPRRLRGELPVGPRSEPEAARVVSVDFVVASDGSVQGLRVVESAGTAWDAAMVAAVTRWAFEPARRDGEAIPVRLIVTHRFG